MNLSDIFPNVRVDDAPQIIPIESHDGYVGAEFIARLAKQLKGDYKKKADIGLTDDFAAFRRHGPDGFDPTQVHELIREFYEHTTRFKMSVTPRWNPLLRPAFRVFRKLFSERVGQFILPIDHREAGKALESHIDTIDVNHDNNPDIRAWIRTYPNSDKAVYVAVYTTLKLDIPYIHVTFPLPEANVTAILVPHNTGKGDLLLTSARGNSRFGGEYYSRIVDDDGDPGTPERVRCHSIPGHKEELHVFVKDGGLFCTHRFYLFGFNFLTLQYEMERGPVAREWDLNELMNKAVHITKGRSVLESPNPSELHQSQL
jgi:hypothetical protein